MDGFDWGRCDTLKSDGARDIGSTVWLVLWVKGDRKRKREARE